ncbi:hypothetical protein CDG81_09995 [Actinopolyspora erythraea]|uniref:Uncharacterized protein n=1 Tax=Actinopolyspora erythraea TaxID=414996 RepID=A0A099D864_9ACTN|nr:hypothetical protein CDG81_09995 [Actinopolyspora erythraea]KGI81555.1 hypothetical protein IL38_09995 [Actinopolyspora erythraea]
MHRLARRGSLTRFVRERLPDSDELLFRMRRAARPGGGAARQGSGANGEGRRAGPVQVNFAVASMPDDPVQWHTSIG